MTPQIRLRRNTAIISTSMGAEALMMDGDAYFGLNPVGAHIWALLETPHSFEELAESVAQTFDAPDSAALSTDVRDFIATLIERDLVVEES